MNNQESKYDFFRNLISCNYDINIGQYDKDMNLISSTLSASTSFADSFFSTNEKEYLINKMKYSPSPIALSDEFNTICIVVPEYQNDVVSLLHVLGPVLSAPPSSAQKNAFIKKITDKTKAYSDAALLFDSLPIVPITNLIQYAIMLNYCVNETKISVSDFKYYHPTETENVPQTETIEKIRIPNNCQYSYEYEKELSEMVEKGNINYLKKSSKKDIPYININSKFENDPIRKIKNMAIILTHICSRAAIQGGLPVDESFILSRNYIQRIEDSSTVTDVYATSYLLQEDYIKRVHARKIKQGCSRFLKTCYDYIDLYYLDENFSSKNMAAHIGYSHVYMCRRFKSEANKSIQEYINEKKLEYSKQLLLTTTRSIISISEELRYCSPSYYSSLFFKYTGLTPCQFRERNTITID